MSDKNLTSNYPNPPWKAVNKGQHWNNPDIDQWDVEHGDCGENVVDGCYTEGTAKLIAAAPELLEALEGMLKVFNNAPNISTQSVYEASQAAINKAKGQIK